jgi:hypothetical protein
MSIIRFRTNPRERPQVHGFHSPDNVIGLGFKVPCSRN